MIKKSIRFFPSLVLSFFMLGLIPTLDPIMREAGMDVFAHTRWNHAPVAQDQRVQTKTGKEKVITLRGTDRDGNSLKYQIVHPPKHGKLSGKPPVVTYLPDPHFYGWDRFTFKVNDGRVDSNVATVRIKVTAVNHAPYAKSQKVKIGEDQPIEITLRATDRDGDSLTFRIVEYPAHGTLSGTPPLVTYTPDPGYQDSDRFTFKTNDGKLDSHVAAVSITVLAANHGPVAQDQSVTTYKGTAASIALVATDADGDPLTYSIVTLPAYGTLSGMPPYVTYSSKSDYSGSDRFTFKANDGKTDSNLATVSITVMAVNHAPAAQNQSVNTNEDTPKAITLVATDSDGDTLIYQIVSQPANGTLSGTPPSVTYTPNARSQGLDSFNFGANDGQAYSNVATISITVMPAANRLSITFPKDGDTIQKSDIRVEGKIVNGTRSETGVVVNGMLANIYGDSFVVNHVPLVEGSNTIVATATDVQRNTVTASLAVSALATRDYVRVTASSESGIPPFETVLTLDSSLDLTNASLTYEGAGEVELGKTEAKEYKVTIKIEGIYT